MIFALSFYCFRIFLFCIFSIVNVSSEFIIFLSLRTINKMNGRGFALGYHGPLRWFMADKMLIYIFYDIYIAYNVGQIQII